MTDAMPRHALHFDQKLDDAAKLLHDDLHSFLWHMSWKSPKDAAREIDGLARRHRNLVERLVRLRAEILRPPTPDEAAVDEAERAEHAKKFAKMFENMASFASPDR